MEERLLALLICCMVSILFFIVATMSIIIPNAKRKRCCGSTPSTVIKYAYIGGIWGIWIPIVEYSIDGNCYETKSKIVGVSASKDKLEFSFAQNGKIVHVNGRFVAERVFPLNSEMTVYYNPKKPQESFLESLPRADILSVSPLIITGMLVIIMGIIIYVMT